MFANIAKDGPQLGAPKFAKVFTKNFMARGAVAVDERGLATVRCEGLAQEVCARGHKGGVEDAV